MPKTVDSSVSTYLATFPSQFLLADLYTITLVGGSVLRYTGAQADITIAGNTWSGTGPIFSRGTIRQVVGITVDTLDVTIAANASHLVNGVPFLKALRMGLFDGAHVVLTRVFFSSPGVLVNTSGSGDLVLFSGIVGDCEVGRFSAKLRVDSDLALLNVQLPRNIYQPGCLNTVYDSVCTLVKSTYTTTSTALGGSTASQILISLGNADGYFNEGVIAFTTGANAGIARSIRTHAAGAVVPLSAFPSAPAAGDTFTIRPGCDKSQATCANKYNNLANFRGQPYVPVVTSVVSV